MNEPALFSDLRASILGDNYRIQAVSWSPKAELTTLAIDPVGIRGELLAHAIASLWPEEMVTALRNAYADRFASGFLAAHGFALNLLRMDEDNWFTFEAARAACAWFNEPQKIAMRRELILFKGVSIAPLMPSLVVAPDLPLIADYGENALHVALTGLAD